MSEAQSQETAAPETTTVGKAKKAKAEKTGNILMDIAAEVEVLTKTKALNLADELAESIEEDYFKLGGVLKLISDNSWFEGFESFDLFVAEKYGFQGRKARYLMSIYDNLVTKQIPWDSVKGLGWTKLKDLALILTPENVDEWVAKVKDLSYAEMMAILKAQSAPTGDPSAKTTSDAHPFKVMLKGDQMEVVQTAMAKAKGELSTEYDSVAIENICAGYVAGTVGGQTAAPDLHELFKSLGWEKVLGVFAEVYPEIDLQVKVPG